MIATDINLTPPPLKDCHIYMILRDMELGIIFETWSWGIGAKWVRKSHVQEKRC